mmetsp:Transcript_25735/g.18222  ORF Transcript_25735/g.18222 Transcript_25735/m.18222 type:complete len:87 (+) Transcript_25735:549-809(+)|eukprot:CAMPEP_0116875618 /NCGR_PEP_ID=MMETSP0463-20121206/7652_1 /TAXON_ID=181622 /ORGANISM="Strombidinopsis sp, Strain SopsisLIS2011" /LENGTH=86 /DNA_ID=CAMNT_0004521587 /DNA_START=461 /DNA_END=721 /DNA_ORIENTATION=+
MREILDDAKYNPMNSGKMELHVGPCKIVGTIDKHHQYPVVGRDSNGEIRCDRRFSHFLQLREILVQRFSGLFIPALPSKKTFSKTS